MTLFCLFYHSLRTADRICHNRDVLFPNGVEFVFTFVHKSFSTVYEYIRVRLRYTRILRFSTGKNKHNWNVYRPSESHQLPFWSFNSFKRLCDRFCQMLTVGANYVSALFIFLTIHFNNFKGQTAVVLIFVEILCLPQYFSSAARMFFYSVVRSTLPVLYMFY